MSRQEFDLFDVDETNIQLTNDLENTLNVFISEHSENQKLPDFARRWVNRLWKATQHLQNKGIVHSTVNMEASLVQWIRDRDHGFWHSFCTAQGATLIAKEEGIDDKRSLELLEAEAVLHDFARSLPDIDYRNGEKHTLKESQKIPKHNIFITSLVRAFGVELGLTPEETRQIATDLLYHDFSHQYSTEARHYQSAFNKISPLGKVLHDADKLFGAGLEQDIKSLVLDTLERNRIGGFKEIGWYLLRDDLSSEQRDKWRYGYRWNADRISAVRNDFYGIPGLTETGKRLFESRREIFSEQMVIRFGEEYDEIEETVSWIQEPNDQNIKIELVGKEQETEEVTEKGIQTAIEEAYNRPLTLSSKNCRSGYIQRGWMIKVTKDGESRLIDPSIARFIFTDRGKETFIEEIKKVFSL